VEALKEGKVRNNLHTVGDGVEALAFLRREGRYAEAPRPDLVLLVTAVARGKPAKTAAFRLSEADGKRQFVPIDLALAR